MSGNSTDQYIDARADCCAGAVEHEQQQAQSPPERCLQLYRRVVAHCVQK